MRSPTDIAAPWKRRITEELASMEPSLLGIAATATALGADLVDAIRAAQAEALDWAATEYDNEAWPTDVCFRDYLRAKAKELREGRTT